MYSLRPSDETAIAPELPLQLSITPQASLTPQSSLPSPHALLALQESSAPPAEDLTSCSSPSEMDHMDGGGAGMPHVGVGAAPAYTFTENSGHYGEACMFVKHRVYNYRN